MANNEGMQPENIEHSPKSNLEIRHEAEPRSIERSFSRVVGNIAIVAPILGICALFFWVGQFKGETEARITHMADQIEEMKSDRSEKEAISELDIRVSDAKCVAEEGTFNFSDLVCTLPDGRTWRHKPLIIVGR